MSPVRTPYYLIDERRLRDNLATVQAVRDRCGARSLLALKCFSTWCVFDVMSEYMDGTTSSSLFEARLGHEQFGKETHAYSVAWSRDDVTEVAGFADTVIFNSISQLREYHDVVSHLDVGLRVNPGISYSHFDLADPARPHSRLGVTEVEALREVAPLLGGLMFHFNCENEDLDSLSAALDVIGERFGSIIADMQWVSLGGGISFTGADYPLDRFCDLLRDFAARFDVQVYLEPGEATITSSAELVTTVLDVVHNEVDVAIVDASIEAHMLDHLIYGTNPRVSVPAPGTHPITVAGRTCLAGDVFGEYELDTELRVGSEVRFADAAGYTMVKTTWFNGVAMPSIAVRRLDGTVEVVREFGYEDFKSSLS